MKKYQTPEAEITTFHSEDILIKSGLTGTDGGYDEYDNLDDWE